jgi:hypothetical protein
MQRLPTGLYVRDGWDWLGSDAVWGTAQKTVVAGANGGIAITNSSTPGEYLDIRFVYATVDQPAPFRLIASPAVNASGGISGSVVSYINVIEGKPPIDLFGITNAQAPLSTILNSSWATNELVFPKIAFGVFVRIPATWFLSCFINAGASNTTIDVTFYGQMVGETDVHTGAASALAQRG